MKKVIIITVIIMAVFRLACTAQGQKKASEDKGIEFEKGASWQQILTKAKADHKYIFVDCYATWCGPCKQMDAEVYTAKKVGDVYNPEFISVKVQMDKTLLDTEEVKKWYGIAGMFHSNYTVTAYPTFLFFDPEGKPVHKVVGSLNSESFIQIALDAVNPEKQYYAILKSFQPGKLDTAELKGLARSFAYQDKELAGKMALDYLTRTPHHELGLPDNMNFMIQFQDNRQVLEIAIDYINKLDEKEFAKKENLDFIVRLSKNVEVYEILMGYIRKLDSNELRKEVNLNIIAKFNKDTEIQTLAKNFIDHLPENQLFTKEIIKFLAKFTDTPKDRGFDLFYQHADKIDAAIAQKGFAQLIAQNVIDNMELSPLLITAKEKGVQPDFEAISIAITKKYNADFAERIILNGKVSWYNFLVNTKKKNEYLPELINCRIEQVKKFRYDTLQSASGSINDISWYMIFLHSDNADQINTAINWMKNVVERNPNNMDHVDTYACLFYKASRLNEALEWEGKGLKIATERKQKNRIEQFEKTIGKMKNGEKIWLESEYIGLNGTSF